MESTVAIYTSDHGFGHAVRACFLAEALIARIKVMSDLDIAETRLPQDGRIELSVGGRSVDLRVSTLPTMYGESTVMRSPGRPSTARRRQRPTGIRQTPRDGPPAEAILFAACRRCSLL